VRESGQHSRMPSPAAARSDSFGGQRLSDSTEALPAARSSRMRPRAPPCGSQRGEHVGVAPSELSDDVTEDQREQDEKTARQKLTPSGE
jgi:hypothetical protein